MTINAGIAGRCGIWAFGVKRRQWVNGHGFSFQCAHSKLLFRQTLAMYQVPFEFGSSRNGLSCYNFEYNHYKLTMEVKSVWTYKRKIQD